jgi:hypothetical protein
MIQIRPVTDLRNKFSEVEAATKKGPVYLTKTGMVLLLLWTWNNI